MNKPEKHVFICTNERKSGGPKISCGTSGGHELRVALNKELRLRDIDTNIRSNASGCLGVCEQGPTLVIYPQGIWYKQVKGEDIPDIVDKSILHEEVVSRLTFTREDWLKE